MLQDDAWLKMQVYEITSTVAIFISSEKALHLFGQRESGVKIRNTLIFPNKIKRLHLLPNKLQ